MKKTVFAISLLSMVFLSSCREDQADDNTQSPSFAASFEDIKTTPDFDWSTEEQYRLQLKGLKTLPFAKKGMIEVKTVSGDLLMRRLVEISQDRNIRFDAPAGLESLKVSFGTIEKVVPVSNNRLSFDYIPFDDQSDIEQDN